MMDRIDKPAVNEIILLIPESRHRVQEMV